MVLVGPSGSGKSHWAEEWFPPNHVVSSDRIRALVGESEHDQRAGTDAFAVLDLVLDRRLRRRLFTVIDTMGLDRDRRRGDVALARRHHYPRPLQDPIPILVGGSGEAGVQTAMVRLRERHGGGVRARHRRLRLT